MFGLGWLINWITRKLQNRNRAIFRFWDGARWRLIDPIAVFRLLKEDPEFEDERDLSLVEVGDMAATRRTLAAIRRSFDVQEFNGRGGSGSGLTDSECLDLLGRFIGYLSVVKKNGSPPQTPRRFMDANAYHERLEVVATNDSSDCGSIPVDSMPVRPASFCAG